MEKELIIITAIILILLFAVCFILVIVLGKRLSRTERKLKQAQEDIEKTRNTLNHPRITDVTVEQQEILEGIQQKLTELEKKQENSLDMVNVVRYFASDKDEGRSSYSVGITNEKKDGLVLTALMYRSGMNLYVKKIDEGVSDYPLSNEEKEAISRSKVTKVIGQGK